MVCCVLLCQKIQTDQGHKECSSQEEPQIVDLTEDETR